MPGIFHCFPVNATAPAVFEAIATPGGLACWWTKSSQGHPAAGEEYRLFFGAAYNWRAMVNSYEKDTVFELRMTSAMADWMNTEVRFELREKDGLTWVDFSHKGWPEFSEHYRISSFCWAMYLRLLKRYVEFGEVVEYEKRLEV